jgi:2-phosphosulfolactate phosphatase
MKIYNKTLEDCHRAEGVVVVVDVLRAFTTTAYAFERGALEILMVSTTEEAFALKRQNPDLLLMGEVNAFPIEGFDLPNSPSVIDKQDLRGKRLVMRSTAGTQGVVGAAHADELYVGSLSVAKATATSIRALGPQVVTFINTGVRHRGGGEEDIACSNYIASLLLDEPVDSGEIEKQVRASKAAARFTGADDSDLPASDLEYATRFDQFSFAMKVASKDNHLVLSVAR